MNYIFSSFLALLLSTTLHAELNMNELETIVSEDQWAVAEGIHNDLPLMIRFRNKLVSGINVSKHPRVIKIYWEYAEHQSGMPSKRDSELMEKFENRMVDALESDLAGVLTAVITTNGSREWVYYVKSVDEFGSRLHNMPQEKEPYPIQIETEVDSGWGYFFDQVRPE